MLMSLKSVIIKHTRLEPFKNHFGYNFSANQCYTERWWLTHWTWLEVTWPAGFRAWRPDCCKRNRASLQTECQWVLLQIHSSAKTHQVPETRSCRTQLIPSELWPQHLMNNVYVKLKWIDIWCGSCPGDVHVGTTPFHSLQYHGYLEVTGTGLWTQNPYTASTKVKGHNHCANMPCQCCDPLSGSNKSQEQLQTYMVKKSTVPGTAKILKRTLKLPGFWQRTWVWREEELPKWNSRVSWVYLSIGTNEYHHIFTVFTCYDNNSSLIVVSVWAIRTLPHFEGHKAQ